MYSKDNLVRGLQSVANSKPQTFTSDYGTQVTNSV